MTTIKENSNIDKLLYLIFSFKFRNLILLSVLRTDMFNYICTSSLQLNSKFTKLLKYINKVCNRRQYSFHYSTIRKIQLYVFNKKNFEFLLLSSKSSFVILTRSTFVVFTFDSHYTFV